MNDLPKIKGCRVRFALFKYILPVVVGTSDVVLVFDLGNLTRVCLRPLAVASSVASVQTHIHRFTLFGDSIHFEGVTHAGRSRLNAVSRSENAHGDRVAACATAGQASTGDTQGDAAGGESDASNGHADENISVERLILRGINLPLATTSVCARQLLATGLISLDVSGTQLGDAGLDKVAAWTPWLRELYAAGNGAPVSCYLTCWVGALVRWCCPCK